MSTSNPGSSGNDRRGRTDQQSLDPRNDRVDTTASRGSDVRDTGAGATSVTDTASGLGLDRSSVVDRQKERYGGIKAGSAFFGWLTATGTAVLLTALLAAAGTAVGLSTGTSVTSATNQATQDPKTVGIAGGIALLVILFLSYYCGGYVAGRMARFNGMKQGIAVWLWAVV